MIVEACKVGLFSFVLLFFMLLLLLFCYFYLAGNKNFVPLHTVTNHFLNLWQRKRMKKS